MYELHLYLATVNVIKCIDRRWNRFHPKDSIHTSDVSSGVNTIHADALAHKDAIASAGKVWAV